MSSFILILFYFILILSCSILSQSHLQHLLFNVVILILFYFILISFVLILCYLSLTTIWYFSITILKSLSWCILILFCVISSGFIRNVILLITIGARFCRLNLISFILILFALISFYLDFITILYCSIPTLIRLVLILRKSLFA